MVLASIFEVIVTEGAKIGLRVNKQKCHVWFPAALDGPLPSVFAADVQCHYQDGGLRNLGCPVGSPAWVRSWVSEFQLEFQAFS